ncbi:unnamed protein product [Polarella glacialis]|uniref:Secreted protein n=1 Tax=Polarella glacialis TaxID=89957 RepID=A0A813LG65_POLGL|nr:unnamed protein product [Polarella glacialis]
MFTLANAMVAASLIFFASGAANHYANKIFNTTATQEETFFAILWQLQHFRLVHDRSYHQLGQIHKQCTGIYIASTTETTHVKMKPLLKAITRRTVLKALDHDMPVRTNTSKMQAGTSQV